MSASLRRDQARLTQQRILEAMRSLLDERGYTATTIAAVAERADVAVPTVYRTYGSKVAIVERLYEIARAEGAEVKGGDQGQTYDLPPATGDLDERLRLITDRAAETAARLASLTGPLVCAARAGDPDVRELAQNIENERLASIQEVGQSLQAFGVDPDHVVDILWVLTAPDLHQRLLQERGWSHLRFRAWLGETLSRQLSPRRPAAGPDA